MTSLQPDGYDEDGDEILPPRGWGEYLYVVTFLTTAAIALGAALFGLGWVLIYNPWAFGVAAFVMVIALAAILISVFNSP